MPFPKVKIYNDIPNYPPRTLIEINGKKVPCVQSIEYEASVNVMPEFRIGVIGIPDIEIDNAVVKLNCSAENVNDAARILRSSIATVPAMREAWVASIEACINECHEVTASGMARAIVDWLIDDGTVFGR